MMSAILPNAHAFARLAAPRNAPMSFPFREPYYSYEELVEAAADFGAEELSALAVAIGPDPDERLWVDRGTGGHVHRLRRKRRRGTYWALDSEPALQTAQWISRKLAGTVLARLNRPGRSAEYAVEPGLADHDVAVWAELEQIWLAGWRWSVQRYVPDNRIQADVLIDEEIRDRIRDIEAELSRFKALRARHLQESFRGGAPGFVSAALDCDEDEAQKVVAARDRYLEWVRSGAAHATDTIPVRRPSGPTGLPEVQAARLMTAACATETVIPDRSYPKPLPLELAPWHVYIEALGHCIAVAVDGVYKPDGDPWEYMTVAPVPMVLEAGWTIQDHVIISPVPYDTLIGAVIWEDDDVER
jgi:hypothetical protein